MVVTNPQSKYILGLACYFVIESVSRPARHLQGFSRDLAQIPEGAAQRQGFERFLRSITLRIRGLLPGMVHPLAVLQRWI